MGLVPMDQPSTVAKRIVHVRILPLLEAAGEIIPSIQTGIP